MEISVLVQIAACFEGRYFAIIETSPFPLLTALCRIGCTFLTWADEEANLIAWRMPNLENVHMVDLQRRHWREDSFVGRARKIEEAFSLLRRPDVPIYLKHPDGA